MRLPSTVCPVAIVGGGFLGRALAAAVGRSAIVTTRSGTWSDGAPPVGVRLAALDITAPADPGAVLDDTRALVVCVAPGRTQDRRALYVGGTRALLEATRDRNWRRVVYVGSTSALPDVDGWVDESCTAMPETERGRVQRDAERVVAEHCTAAGVPWLVLRLGGLYGPGRALDRIYRGRDDGPRPGDGHAPTNLIHRDDAVAAIVAGLAAPADVTGIVHVVDDDHTTRRRMYGETVTWARSVPPGAPPRGKRVGNLRLKTALRVRLLHPTHGIAPPDSVFSPPPCGVPVDA